MQVIEERNSRIRLMVGRVWIATSVKYRDDERDRLWKRELPGDALLPEDIRQQWNVERHLQLDRKTKMPGLDLRNWLTMKYQKPETIILIRERPEMNECLRKVLDSDQVISSEIQKELYPAEEFVKSVLDYFDYGHVQICQAYDLLVPYLPKVVCALVLRYTPYITKSQFTNFDGIRHVLFEHLFEFKRLANWATWRVSPPGFGFRQVEPKLRIPGPLPIPPAIDEYLRKMQNQPK